MKVKAVPKDAGGRTIAARRRRCRDNGSAADRLVKGNSRKRRSTLLIARPSLLVVAALLLVTALPGCGFRLRGHADLPFESIYVDTPGYSILGNQLRRAIRTGTNAIVTDQPQEAQVVLKIVSEAQDKVILSLSSAGRVSEFDLRYRVNYRLVNHASVDIVPPAEIVLHRDLTYSDFEILAKASEEQLLYNDMKADAVQQILRRLSVIKLPT